MPRRVLILWFQVPLLVADPSSLLLPRQGQPSFSMALP